MSNFSKGFRTAKIVDTMLDAFGQLDISLPAEWNELDEERVFIRFSVQTDNGGATLADVLLTCEFISGNPSIVRFYRGSVSGEIIIRGEVIRS